MDPAFSVVFFTTLAGTAQGLLLALFAAEWALARTGAATDAGFHGAGAVLAAASPTRRQAVQPNSFTGQVRRVRGATAERGRAVRSTKGLTPLADLQIKPAQPPTSHHPLMQQLPNNSGAKHLARHRTPTLRADVVPQTEQSRRQRAVPKGPRQCCDAQTNKS